MTGKAMSKKLAIILIVAAFIVGAVVTGGSVRYFFIKRQATLNKILDYQFECQPEISTSLVSIHTLQRFRSDETSNSKAVEYLELQLDYSVAGIWKYVEHHSLSESNSFPAMMAVLRLAKNYRELFPHTNQDVSVQKSINQAFLLVK